MLSFEKGTLPGSHLYFFTPSETARTHFFYFVWVGHYFCTHEYDINRQSYPPLLLLHVRSGVLKLTYENESLEAKAGDIVLLDCQNPHHYFADDGLEFVYFHFDGVNSHEYCRYLIEINSGPVFRLKHNQKIGSIIYDTTTRLLNNQFISDAECSNLIYTAISRLAYQDETPLEEDSPVGQVIHYIRTHISQSITIQDLAGLINISPYYFIRLFQSETGYTPHQFVLKIRMEIAKTLLKTTKIPIEEIAERVGYSSGASFRNAFVKCSGLSPSHFRNFPI